MSDGSWQPSPAAEGEGSADTAVLLREVDTRDRQAAQDLHTRCSRDTLTRRYHGTLPDSDGYLDHLLSPGFGRSLGAYADSGQLVALGHLLWDGAESEVALLVADGWQGLGIGARLLRALCELARHEGHTRIYALTQPSNAGVVTLMHRLGLPVTQQMLEGDLVIEAQVRALPHPRSHPPGPLTCRPRGSY